MAEFLHPSVSSKIIDNSFRFVTSQGLTRLFVAFTSDTGPDNRIITITSPSEWLFHFGEPNMRKHGQAAYNALEWLKSQGMVDALRVMPENAGYAHSILNVQTKTSTKQVMNADGELVTMPHVDLRTVYVTAPASNTSVEALEGELTRLDREKTFDGYENNWLYAVLPRGRGKAYNNLGHRLTLTDAFDETYPFRVYGFEVTRTNENGSVQVIEGPFYVSLDPDAISTSGESMFIKNVVEKYSNFVDILFNENAYDRLGEIINPHVNPNVLDFLTGVTRVIGGKPETYFCPETGKEEDVHIALHEYVDGYPTGRLAFADADNAIENAVVGLDNSVRSGQYNEAVASVESLKQLLSAFRNDNVPALFKELAHYGFEQNAVEVIGLPITDPTGLDLSDDNAIIFTVNGESVTLDKEIYADVEAIYTDVRSQVTTVDVQLVGSALKFVSDPGVAITIMGVQGDLSLIGLIEGTTEPVIGEETLIGGSLYETQRAFEKEYRKLQELATKPDLDAYQVVSAGSRKVVPAVKPVLDAVKKALDYIGVFDANSAIGLLADLETARGTLQSIELLGTHVAGKKGDLSAHTNKLNNAKMEDATTKLNVVADIVYDLVDIVGYLEGLDTTGQTHADGAIAEAKAKLTAALEALALAQDENILESEFAGAVNTAVDTCEQLLDITIHATDLVYAENLLDSGNRLDHLIYNVVSGTLDVLQNILASLPTLSTGEQRQATVTSIVTAIDGARDQMNDLRRLTYNVRLQNPNNAVSFGAGSDGDLDEKDPALKRQTTKDLLIKAYTGMIDTRLTNKKEFPIDMVLDANYDVEVKNAIVSLASEIRRDFVSILDTNFTANPQQALDFRESAMQVSSFFVSIFTQDFVVYDEYTGQDVRVTTPYFLASKIPQNDASFGIHWNFVGPRRGTISGFKHMSWNPTPPWKEQLYKRQINYVEQDQRSTRLGSQLTSQTVVSALSDLNNVRTLLRIQRDVEEMAEDYKFEFNDGLTLSSFQSNLDDYLQKWVSNRACDSISGSVYASDYDRQQKIARVKIDIVFNSIIERVLIDLVVGK